MARYVRAMFLAVTALALASCSSQGEDEIQIAKARRELRDQLQEFSKTKEPAEVAKAAPEVVKASQRFISQTPKDEEQFEIVSRVVRVLEMKGQYDAAVKVMADAKSQYADADKNLAKAAAKSYEMAEKRAGVVGKPLKLRGTLVGGKAFDWSKYKDRVVLVDFWATWCPPCRAELPNVKENYAKLHEKGFEVVGVSLDDKVDVLTKFIETEKLPWENLLPEKEEERGWNHPLAEKFGVEGIPFTMLVNREGKVVALNVRGDGLGEEVEKLLAEKPEKK